MPYDANPEWTERGEKRGLDPLGMQNSGVALYQKLIPGISNVTLRMRYYGLYCWLSDAYAQHSGSTDRADWQRWVRRMEAIYALVANVVGNETGVAGAEWAQRALAAVAGPIDFEAATRPQGDGLYLKQRWGVYGGAYSTQMAEMGLMVTAGGHDMFVRTPELGKAAADAFAESIGSDRSAILVDAIESGTIDRSDLQSLPAIGPSNIPPDSPERQIYEDVLFGTHDAARERDRSRACSLTLILAVARDRKVPPSASQVRWSLFEPVDLPDPSLETHRLRWEVYHLHDLWQIAWGALLKWCIEVLEAHQPLGLSPSALADEATDRMVQHPAAPSVHHWRDAVGSRPVAEIEGVAAEVLRGTAGAERAWRAIELVWALQGRVESRPDLAEAMAASFPRGNDFLRSVLTELPWVQERGDRPVADVLRELLLERILRRHTWVAMRKLRYQRDYTFLFDSHDGRLFARAATEPTPTNPRLDTSVRFLRDIGLLDDDGLTDAGRARLEVVA